MLRLLLAASTAAYFCTSWAAILRYQHKFSHAHWLIFIVNNRTDTWIYNLYDAAMSESWQFVIVKNKWTSVFHASVLLDTESRGNERELTIWQFVIVKNKWTSVFHASVLLDTESRHNIVKVVCGYSLWIHSYFENVMTKFMINNRTDAWKTDVNLLNRTPLTQGLTSWWENTSCSCYC